MLATPLQKLLLRPFLILLFFAVGCSSNPPQNTVAKKNAQRVARQTIHAFTLVGRISIENQGKRDRAQLRWTHNSNSDDFLLTSYPLGLGLAHLVRSQNAAGEEKLELALANGEHYSSTNEAEFMRRAFSISLPLATLAKIALADTQPLYDSAGKIAAENQSKQLNCTTALDVKKHCAKAMIVITSTDSVRNQTSADTPDSLIKNFSTPSISSLWLIDYKEYESADENALPTLLELQNEQKKVHIKVDSWQIH